MAFFPPSLSPNNKVFITDERSVAETGISRFANYQQEAVIYWPWLSWNEIDVAVGPDQRAIPRLTLIGESGHRLFSVAADGIGAIVKVGSAASDQAWEVIHNFDWFDRDGLLKKFAVAWLRLWTGAAAAPPEFVEGSEEPASALPISEGVLYAATVDAGFQFFQLPTFPAGPFMLDLAFDAQDLPGTFHVHHGPTTAPVLDWSLNLSARYALNLPAPGMVIAIQPNVPASPFDVQWKVTPLQGQTAP